MVKKPFVHIAKWFKSAVHSSLVRETYLAAIPPEVGGVLFFLGVGHMRIRA